MRTHRIAAIGGDGIGPEVVAAGVQALKACAERDSHLPELRPSHYSRMPFLRLFVSLSSCDISLFVKRRRSKTSIKCPIITGSCVFAVTLLRARQTALASKAAEPLGLRRLTRRSMARRNASLAPA